jgi:hypothetical protein
MECCTSRDILQTATVRKLSRRARAYICAYYSINESKNNDNVDTPTLTLPLIERLVKAFKTHRAALGFVNSHEKGVFQMNTTSVLREK